MGGLGLVLFAADRIGEGRRGADAISTPHALLIGIAQAAAIVPGVSRSGATISMARLLGYRREEAARFSFLLATPITFGAALVKVPKLVAAGGDEIPLAAGMLAAALVGLLSIRVLLSYVRTRDYSPFAYYRFAFAVIVGAALLLDR
jgi:undecaprenyl-diphosphatase